MATENEHPPIRSFAKSVLCTAAFLSLILLAIFALTARIDSKKEFELMRLVDVSLGCLFFLTCVTYSMTNQPAAKLSGRRLARFALGGCLVTAAFLLAHEAVNAVRSPSQRSLTLSKLMVLSNALSQYEADCDEFPTQEQGLIALTKNPGLPKWKGPYADSRELSDLWGDPFLYRLEGDRAIISCKRYPEWSQEIKKNLPPK